MSQDISIEVVVVGVGLVGMIAVSCLVESGVWVLVLDEYMVFGG